MSGIVHRLARGALASVLVFGFATAASADEVMLKGVSAFPKSHNNTKGFLQYIDAVNKAGKGVVHITFIGGPEVTPPPQQPTALRNGLFDIQFGPAAYYLGVFPEGDFTSGFKTPMESRKLGGFEMVDKVMREKIGATFLARFYQGLGLYMELKEKPSFRPDGLPDLSGMKIRSSPAYRDFIKVLGGTPVVMPITQIYTALERGVVQGAGGDLDTVIETGLNKFLKVWIEPPFNMAGILLIFNANKWDNLPANAKKVLMDEALVYEKKTMDEVTARQIKVKKEMRARGMEAVELKGAVAEKYVETYMQTPWGRMKNNPNVKIDVQALRKAWF